MRPARLVRRGGGRWLAACVVVLALAAPALAAGTATGALSPAVLDSVGARPAAGAIVPLDLPFSDERGRSTTLGRLLDGRPAVLILADYRCTQLCGSILGIAGRALHDSGLRPGEDFRLIVVGFNPDASTQDAAALSRDQLDAVPDIRAGALLLTAAPGSIDALAASVGFTTVRDRDAGRYAHPIDLFVLTPGGAVSRVVNGLSVDGATLRTDLVEAGSGRIGALIDRLHVLCYGLDPLSGASTNLAQWLLRGGAALTLLGAAALIFGASRRRVAR